MKLDENKKLTLTEEELDLVKRANMMASPSIAGLYLRSYVRNSNLVESAEELPDVNFYAECVQAYRKKNYEVI
jgi:hypothetical protein